MSKTLVVYYSAQGHTKKIAQKIAANTNAGLYEIIPTEQYTEDDLNWADENARASHEYVDKTLRDIKINPVNIPNWSEIETIILGYPIWWGISAWAVNAFLKQVDLNGKKVIPFCTSQSSGAGESDALLQEDAKAGDWTKCHRFSQDATDDDIRSWTDQLNQ